MQATTVPIARTVSERSRHDAQQPRQPPLRDWPFDRGPGPVHAEPSRSKSGSRTTILPVNEYQSQLAVSHNNLEILLINMGHPTERSTSHWRSLVIYQRFGERQSIRYPVPELSGRNPRQPRRPAQPVWTDLPLSAGALPAGPAIDERLVRDHPEVIDFWLDLAGNHTNVGVLLGSDGSSDRSPRVAPPRLGDQ